MAELVRLRSEAMRLNPATLKNLSALLPGPYRALQQGRGLEFDEVRTYQPGDDYRSLDWRVTARTGRLHTKLFREERERSVHFLLDAGPAMHFGSRQAFKWVTAARCAAVLAWLAVANSDKVGGMVFGIGQRCSTRHPQSGQSGAIRLFSLLEKITVPSDSMPPPVASLVQALAQLRQVARPGSQIFLFSDFANDNTDEMATHFAALSRHHSVSVIFVYDPLEVRLPPRGHYPFSNGHDVLVLDTGDTRLREHYQQKFAERREAVSALCRKYRMGFISLATCTSLRDFFHNARKEV